MDWIKEEKVVAVNDQPGGGTQWVVVDEYGKTVLIDTLIEEELLVPVSGPYYEDWIRNREAANGH
jgi:glyoxylase-like metal-dependent hydrolase (beta-lactamase superfamily II)